MCKKAAVPHQDVGHVSSPGIWVGPSMWLKDALWHFRLGFKTDTASAFYSWVACSWDPACCEEALVSQVERCRLIPSINPGTDEWMRLLTIPGLNPWASPADNTWHREVSTEAYPNCRCVSKPNCRWAKSLKSWGDLFHSIRAMSLSSQHRAPHDCFNETLRMVLWSSAIATVW